MTSAVAAPPVSLRRITALALPALVVLGAEPLYVLVDTAVVGHLGRVPLAALAIGGTVLSAVAILGNFLAYGTTSRAARRYGAGDRAAAVREGVQASWLALAIGLATVVAGQVAAGPVARALAGSGPDAAAVAAGAETWLRVAVLGAPGIMLALAGNGWLRGVQETRRPLVYVLAANGLSAVLCPVLVYPAGLGLVGSAVANVVAQTLAAAMFVRALVAERADPRPAPRLLLGQLAMARDLTLRTLSFQVCFLSAAAVAARFGAASLAAHQIALQLWFFTALLLDALAIAAQSLVGADLGAGDVPAARQTARRVAVLGALCGLVLGLVLAVLAGVLPGLFTGDAAVVDAAWLAWPWLVVLQPIGGVVFALDGVLIGAGDVRFLRTMMLTVAVGVFLPAIWLAYAFDLGLGGVWVGLTLFVAARLVAMLLRLRGSRWSVPGATR